MPNLNIKTIEEPFVNSAETYPRLVSNRSDDHPLLKAFSTIEFGQLLLRTPEGDTYDYKGHNNGPEAYLKLNDWQALDALIARGEIGFAEAYMDGLWDSDDLPTLLSFGLANADALGKYFYGKPIYALWMRAKSLLRGNSINGSRRNIKEHYDLGNEFYALWLDKSMTYSSA